MKGTKALMLTLALLVGAALATGPASTKPARVPISDQDVVRSQDDDNQAAPKPDDDKAAPVQPKGDANKTDQVRPTQTRSRTATVQAPTPATPPRSGVTAAPNPPSQPGDLDHPPRGGQGGGRGGHGNGGYGGGHRHGGGWGWRGGHHDEWRHRNYHGSWSFLWHHGPIIFPVPIYFPHVIRIPHHRVGVYVRQTGTDYVGTAFANSVREHLSEQGLRVVYSEDDAKLELYLVSMEQDPEDAGYGSAVSVSYIWNPGNRFITAQMLDVGVDEVDDLALSVAGYADDLVDDYR